jgi:hypothetical protein
MWLLEPTVKRALERAYEGAVTPSVESQQRFEASLSRLRSTVLGVNSMASLTL